jgi:hypothetical protein
MEDKANQQNQANHAADWTSKIESAATEQEKQNK